MKITNYQLKPQDVVVLLKIIALNTSEWTQIELSEGTGLSQSEVSQSLTRLKYASLLDISGKIIMRLALMDFLQYGLPYAFPQRPGAIMRGIPTAHAAPPLNTIIESAENYVWPSGKGKVRGQSINPLYPSVTEIAMLDSQFYELLALCDALRVGRAREKELAVKELKKRILNGK